MKRTELLQTLHQLAQDGVWALPGMALGRLMQDRPSNRSVSLARAVRNGHIERLAGGFYRNTLAELPSNHLELLSNWLRPMDWFYLSLESALHEAGFILQIPNRLTFVTTGRSYTYRTPVGIIEFTHTERPPEVWWEHVEPDWHRGIRIAKSELAIQDLRRAGRNVNLINEVNA